MVRTFATRLLAYGIIYTFLSVLSQKLASDWQMSAPRPRLVRNLDGTIFYFLILYFLIIVWYLNLFRYNFKVSNKNDLNLILCKIKGLELYVSKKVHDNCKIKQTKIFSIFSNNKINLYFNFFSKKC